MGIGFSPGCSCCTSPCGCFGNTPDFITNALTGCAAGFSGDGTTPCDGSKLNGTFKLLPNYSDALSRLFFPTPSPCIYGIKLNDPPIIFCGDTGPVNMLAFLEANAIFGADRIGCLVMLTDSITIRWSASPSPFICAFNALALPNKPPLGPNAGGDFRNSISTITAGYN